MAEETIVRELTEEEIVADVNQDYAEKYGFSDVEDYVFKAEKGLNEDIVRSISKMKGEPEWMLEFRLKGYAHYLKRPLPEWGADLHQIGRGNAHCYREPDGRYP
ncbi:MAG: Fe-S cluster assembly protein SufB, partial [Simkaniaceae bacterium]|nr:Fe-S cluster assembly protein SufB [Simkaniaceae bacterium]